VNYAREPPISAGTATVLSAGLSIPNCVIGARALNVASAPRRCAWRACGCGMEQEMDGHDGSGWVGLVACAPSPTRLHGDDARICRIAGGAPSYICALDSMLTRDSRNAAMLLQWLRAL